MSDELKPCPFCKHKQEYTYSGWGKRLFIKHDKECILRNSRSSYQSWENYESMNNDEFTQAIDSWNTRPVEDALRQQLTEAKAELTFEIKQGDRLKDASDKLLASGEILLAENKKLRAKLAKANTEIERLEDTQYQPMYRDGENPNE